MKKVPNYIAKTPRKRAEGVYVFPRKKSYPIGDLYHARAALVFALSPTNSSSRAKVVKAVAKLYPQYNWASWWNSKRKKGIPTWGQIVGKKTTALAANPRRRKIKSMDELNKFMHPWFYENFRILSDSDNSSYGETIWISPKLGFKLTRKKRAGTLNPFRWEHSSGATGYGKFLPEAIEQMKKVKSNPRRRKNSSHGQPVNPHSKRWTLTTFSEKYFGKNYKSIPMPVRKEFWNDFQYEFEEPINIYMRMTYRSGEVKKALKAYKNPRRRNKNPKSDETAKAIRLMLAEAKKFDQMGLLFNVEKNEVPENIDYGETVYSLMLLYSSNFNVNEKDLAEALANAYPDHFPRRRKNSFAKKAREAGVSALKGAKKAGKVVAKQSKIAGINALILKEKNNLKYLLTCGKKLEMSPSQVKATKEYKKTERAIAKLEEQLKKVKAQVIKNPRSNPMKKSLRDRITLANKYIQFAMDHEIWGQETSVDWSGVIQFTHPIKISPTGRTVTIKYTQPYALSGGYGVNARNFSETLYPNKFDGEEEIRYIIKGLISAIKKGAKDEGWKIGNKGLDFTAVHWKDIARSGSNDPKDWKKYTLNSSTSLVPKPRKNTRRRIRKYSLRENDAPSAKQKKARAQAKKAMNLYQSGQAKTLKQAWKMVRNPRRRR